MRLFVAVQPPDPILDEVARAAAALPSAPGVRVTARSSWHVTLRFLGEVEDATPAVDALGGLHLEAVEARLGPAVTMLSRQVVAIPVAGLEEVAEAVIAATAGIGQPPDTRPFRGHLTLARLRRGARPRAVQPALGHEISATWTATDLTLFRSHLGATGPTYEALHTQPLQR